MIVDIVFAYLMNQFTSVGSVPRNLVCFCGPDTLLPLIQRLLFFWISRKRIKICFENTPIFRLLRSITVRMLQGADKKVRVLVHLEDEWEVRYVLLGFGIPVDCKSAVGLQ